MDKGVWRSIKLGVIKHVWNDLVGYFMGLGTLKHFPCKLIAIASILYAI